MGRKVIKGLAKKHVVPEINPKGYRPVWETGLVSYRKKISKISGVNRPSI